MRSQSVVVGAGLILGCVLIGVSGCGQGSSDANVDRQIVQLHKKAWELFQQGKHEEADQASEQAWHLALKHLRTVMIETSSESLAGEYRQKGDYAKAIRIRQEALSAYEKAGFGPSNSTVVYETGQLAQLYAHEGNCAEAIPLYQRAAELVENLSVANEHLIGAAKCLHELGKLEEAKAVWSRVKHLHPGATDPQLDIGTAVSIGQRREDDEQFAFYGAVFAGRVEQAQKFLDRNPLLIERSPNSRSPLHVAVSFGRVELVKLLLERGANANVSDAVGATPLHVVAQRRHRGLIPIQQDLEVMKLLMAHGADVNAKDHQGRTPLWYARDNDIAHLLREHDGKR